MSDTENGVIIVDIIQGCLGCVVGLRVGDIITRIEGEDIKSLESYVYVSQKLYL